MTTYNLNSLDQFPAMIEAMAVASSVAPPVEDYANFKGTAEINITLENARSLFTIHSDSLDVTDSDSVANDFAIKLDNSAWPEITVSGLTVDEADQADTTAFDQSVKKNYVRQLAKTMFGDAAVGLTDIFTNEAALAAEVSGHDVQIRAAVVNALGTNGASVPINSSESVSSELFAQKYGADSAWVAPFASDWSAATETVVGSGVYELKFPFIAGDKLVFGVTYTRGPADTELGGITKTAEQLKQAYKVTLNITA